MKLKTIITVAALSVIVAGCGEGGTKFNPKGKESSMSDADRQAAIEAKRASISEKDSMLIFGNGLKLSVLSPAPQGLVTDEVSSSIAQKMQDIVTSNGIGGVGGNPDLVFAGSVASVDKKLTGTAPQKTMVTFTMQYYVANIGDGTVFASTTEDVKGVGDNEEKAMRNAVKEMKNSNKLQKLLKDANEKIISYYNDNAASIEAKVKSLMAANNYEEAYSLMRGVPEQATALFPFVQENLPALMDKMLVRDAAANLAQLKSAISANDGEYSDEVGVYLKLIPANAPQYAEANKLFDDYLKRLQAKADDKEQYERQVADKAAEEQFQMQLAQMEYDEKIAKRAASEKKWDRVFGIIDNSISCIRDVGVTFGRNNSWTSFLNMSNFRDLPSQQDKAREAKEKD